MAAPGVPTLELDLYESAGYVRVRVEFDATTDELDVYRVGPSGIAAYVRGAVARDVAGSTVEDVVDYETPFGVAVNYFAVARNVDGETSSVAYPITLDVDDDWLVDLDDARNTGPVLVESFSELEYTAPQGVHRIIGRRTPIVTSDLRWTPSGRLVLATLTVQEARRVRDALGSSSPLLLRSRVERGVGNMYLLPGNLTERRVSRIATEPARRWEVDVVEIDRPGPTLYVPFSTTWEDVLARFATWQEVLDGRVDWGDLLYNREGMPDSELYSREPAFPSRDV